jgi:hypothetical protein
MPSQGYVRFPTIYQDRIIFVAEDDLWLVSSEGGRAERLTAGVGEARYPRFSLDGTRVAFAGREEGPSEVYVMSAQGSEARRLTFEGVTNVAGWSPVDQVWRTQLRMVQAGCSLSGAILASQLVGSAIVEAQRAISGSTRVAMANFSVFYN